MTTEEARTAGKALRARIIAQALKSEFPWVDTEEELNSCADVVEQLELFYKRMKKLGDNVKPKILHLPL